MTLEGRIQLKNLNEADFKHVKEAYLGSVVTFKIGGLDTNIHLTLLRSDRGELDLHVTEIAKVQTKCDTCDIHPRSCGHSGNVPVTHCTYWVPMQSGPAVPVNTPTVSTNADKTCVNCRSKFLKLCAGAKYNYCSDWSELPKNANEISKACDEVRKFLFEKNAAYGDSALNPVRIFSSADPTEQIKVRIDDKLSRMQKGSEFKDDDTILDLIGYLILLRISDKNSGRTETEVEPT